MSGLARRLVILRLGSPSRSGGLPTKDLCIRPAPGRERTILSASSGDAGGGARATQAVALVGRSFALPDSRGRLSPREHRNGWAPLWARESGLWLTPDLRPGLHFAAPSELVLGASACHPEAVESFAGAEDSQRRICAFCRLHRGRRRVHRSFDCVAVRCADDNFAQDDKVGGAGREKLRSVFLTARMAAELRSAGQPRAAVPT